MISAQTIIDFSVTPRRDKQILIMIQGSTSYYDVLQSAFGYNGYHKQKYGFSTLFEDRFGRPNYWGTFLWGITPEDTKLVENLLTELKTAVFIEQLLEQTFALDYHFTNSGRSTVGELLFQAKYKQNLSALNELINYYKKYIKAYPTYCNVDYIVAVPPSPKKKDLNLPTEIVKKLSETLNIPDMSGFLYKTKTTNMKDLSGDQKSEHIRGVFDVRPNHPFKGKRLLIIDDICHSGATLNELGNVLRSAGAKVYGLTATKTFRDT